MFDILLYVVAIVFVLAFTSTPKEVVSTVEPDELDFSASVSEPLEEVSPALCVEALPEFTPSVSVTAPVSAPVSVEEVFPDDFSDLLEISAQPQSLDFANLNIVQLRSLGSLDQIKGASRWTKTQAIAALSAA